MMKRILVLCFLILFSPFLAAAMPISEFVADVVSPIEGSLPNAILRVAFIPEQPLAVQVNGFTVVRDIDIDNIEVGTRVKIHACFTADGLIALEVEPSVDQGYELKGYVEKVENRTITQIDGSIDGIKIPVPEIAEIMDGAGNPVKFFDLGGKYVKVEGIVESDSFVVTEVTSIAPFDCPSDAQHIFTTLKPADSTHKMTEHYCELSSGMREGANQTSFTDYTGQSVSTYTVGKYVNGQRHGYWLTIDVTGNVVQECLYQQGSLLDGDLLCPIE